LIELRVTVLPQVRRSIARKTRIIEIWIVNPDRRKHCKGLKISLFVAVPKGCSIEQGDLDIDTYLFQIILPRQGPTLVHGSAAQHQLNVQAFGISGFGEEPFGLCLALGHIVAKLWGLL